MGSLFTIAIILGVVALGAAGWYVYTKTQGDNSLFAARERRRATSSAQASMAAASSC